jgi:hypothetical protein
VTANDELEIMRSMLRVYPSIYPGRAEESHWELVKRAGRQTEIRIRYPPNKSVSCCTLNLKKRFPFNSSKWLRAQNIQSCWRKSCIPCIHADYDTTTADQTLTKSSIFWDITPYSVLKVNGCFGGTSRLHRKLCLQDASCWCLAWLTLQPWR